MSGDEALVAMFGESGPPFLRGVDAVLKRAQTHRYSFVSEDSFRAMAEQEPTPVAAMNVVLAHETLEKCHLAAVTLILRNKGWIEAMAQALTAETVFGFAAAARGFIESAADGLDGLLPMALGLAENQKNLKRCLAGLADEAPVDLTAFDERLDHFLFAGWTRDKDKVLRAKDTQAYVLGAQSDAAPELLAHWRRLCTITHPSSASLNLFYAMAPERGVRVDAAAGQRVVRELLAAIRSSLVGCLSYAMNPSLLVLRVMHKFEGYPRIPELKAADFRQLPVWAKLAKHL